MRRWWVLPLAIFAASRVVESLVLWHLFGMQHDQFIPAGGGPVQSWGHPVTLTEGLSNWDGAWYREIANHGYPAHLPRIDGHVRQNAWAFYPMFPGLVRLIMFLGLSFENSAFLLSITCAAIASCLLFRLVSEHASRFTASMAVVGLMFAPMAPIFEAAYTESLALLLLLLALSALGHRRYAWFSVFTLLIAFARPMSLPLALVCGVHWLLRWWHRDQEPFEMRDRIKVGAAAVWAAVTFGLWPLVAGLRTGELGAYFKTQNAWAGSTADHGWPSWLQQALHFGSTTSVTVVIGVLIGAVALAVQRGAKAWGPELRTWTWAYPLYILGTARPTSSIFRYLLLTITPLWPVPAVSERVKSVPARIGLVALVVGVGVSLQFLWLRAYFVIWPHRMGAP
jgi:hypothetical protein